MKQIIDLSEHRITIEKKYRILRKEPFYQTRNLDSQGRPLVNFRDILIPNPDTLEWGIYIAMSDGTIIKPSDYKNGMSTEGVVLHTAHASIVISKFDHPEKLTHDEAVKIGIFNRHEAIEYHINKKEVSDVLILIGGAPLKDDWYWLLETTEFSPNFAWYYIGTRGILYNLNKDYSINVRPVSALKDFFSSF